MQALQNVVDFQSLRRSREKSFINVIHHDGKPSAVVINGLHMDRYELLAFALRLSEESEKDAWEVMNLASRLFHWQDDWAFDSLYGAAAMEITRWYTEKEMR